MTNLLRANQELFRRTPDECFESLDELAAFCQRQKEKSHDRWEAPANFAAVVGSCGPVVAGDRHRWCLPDERLELRPTLSVGGSR